MKTSIRLSFLMVLFITITHANAQDMDVFPDTLRFFLPENYNSVGTFYIHNPNPDTLHIQYIQQTGAPAPYLLPWYITPDIPSFPVSIAPGDTMSWDVQFYVTDAFGNETIVYDTLNIYTLTDTAGVIIAADSIAITIGMKEEALSSFVISPNPFRGEVSIRFDSRKSREAVINLYDQMMRPVRGLFAGMLKQGKNHFTWDGCNDQGNRLPDGIYFLRVQTEGQTITRKLILAD